MIWPVINPNIFAWLQCNKDYLRYLRYASYLSFTIILLLVIAKQIKPYSAWSDVRRQNLTSLDVRF